MTSQEPSGEIAFEELRRKYEQERQKRLRMDALGQYQSLTGQLGQFGKDPHADENFVRDPVERETDVVIIGGGFGGLLSASHLRKLGITDLVIIDKASDFGGTWYWNRYPGVRCDVESYVYMPLLEDTGFMPSEKYARGSEILEQCRKIADHYDLYRDALLQTAATTLHWKPERQRWDVRTDRGDHISARFVISCTGFLSNPKLPRIPGIETFEGHSFHTSRWDYDYTGGSSDGNLTGLHDKRVGVIGTGSTGIQCIPPLAASAQHLYVFQRTPTSIDVRGNRPTDAAWFQSLQPGWQSERVWNFTYWTSGVRQGQDMIADSWTNLLGQPSALTGGDVSEVDPEELERAEIAKMELVRQRIAATVKDQHTAEALKPYYNYFCKRPGFSDDYLETFNRPNVTLVDTDGRGVECITPKGVIAGGKEYELDCLIYATGFDFMTEYTHESGLQITGRKGISLEDAWSNGARTLYGMHIRNFPNLLMLSPVQAGITINYLHVADAQTKYIASIIAYAIEEGVGEVEPTREAESDWVQEVIELGGPRKAFLQSCTPGYYNHEGEQKQSLELNVPYPGSGLYYLKMIEDIQESLSKLETTRQPDVC